ncbi:MAG: hypothetical protein U9N40_00610 [Euryarchaeota archaeon]|nr:hypothetical protein [Euryarchaeota archaeon]
MDLSFNEINDGRIYLVLSEPLDIRKKNIEMIREITDKDFTIIIITTNEPYIVLRKDYEKMGINLEKVHFIDAITKYAVGKESEGAVNCTFINNPSNLTEMGIAVTELLKKIDGDKVWILLDSVNSMLIYIPSINLTKFIHFITSKLRILEMSGVLLAVEKGIEPSTLTQLESFVDGVIEDDE